MSKDPSAQTLTFSIQDYLKSIYELTVAGQAASTNALSERLGVSAASVTGMLQKLSVVRPALVVYKKHHGAKLTRRGQQAALEVIRHHRLLETWLVESLGYSWDEVHTEAEIMEHAMSDHLEQRISTALGNPARDPHGEPIPSARLRMPPDRSFPLAELAPGEEAVIRRVRADDTTLLRRLRQLGLVPGTRLRIVGQPGPRRPVLIQVEPHVNGIRLGKSIVRSIYVESLDSPHGSRGDGTSDKS